MSVLAARDAQPAAQPPKTPDAEGRRPFDLTGNWVSVVTEDWRGAC